MSIGSEVVLAAASSGALFISIASFVFACLSWRESHRPIVIARISTDRGGEIASPIEIKVENTGNRPAVNVALETSSDDLNRVLSSRAREVERAEIERIFTDETYIPVLGNGQSVTNAFGTFEEERPTWEYKETLIVGIRYESLRGRKFYGRVPIWLVDNRGFALTFWETR